MSVEKEIKYVLWLYLLVVALVISFWGTVGYVIWHFVSKFW